MTDLVNRAVLIEELQRVIAGRSGAAVLLIDLDGFKSVNDEHGHAVGDLVLAAAARRIERATSADDTCGRLGGDEFLVITTEVGEVEQARLAERILGGVEETILANERSIQISASIGVAFTGLRADASSVIDRADQLMYSAKTIGRGYTRFETADDMVAVERPSRSKRTHNADAALVEEAIAGLRILFQPIVDASAGSVIGVEALTRGPSGMPSSSRTSCVGLRRPMAD